MYSMPQHAVTNGYWKIEYFRAQPMASSSLDVRTCLVPFESSLAPDVEEPEHEDSQEHHHLSEPEPAEPAVDHRPRPDEHELDVDQDEEDGDRGELDRESPLGHGDRVLAALERLGLHRREPPRREEFGDAEQRAGDERREGERHEQRGVSHCRGVREAGAIGGWPATRCDPAPFPCPLLIPSGVRGAGAIGGWPATRCDSAPFGMALFIPPEAAASA